MHPNASDAVDNEHAHTSLTLCKQQAICLSTLNTKLLRIVTQSKPIKTFEV